MTTVNIIKPNFNFTMLQRDMDKQAELDELRARRAAEEKVGCDHTITEITQLPD